jgi:hypothetical protein
MAAESPPQSRKSLPSVRILRGGYITLVAYGLEKALVYPIKINKHRFFERLISGFDA